MTKRPLRREAPPSRGGGCQHDRLRHDPRTVEAGKACFSHVDARFIRVAATPRAHYTPRRRTTSQKATFATKQTAGAPMLFRSSPPHGVRGHRACFDGEALEPRRLLAGVTQVPGVTPDTGHSNPQDFV